MEDVLEGVAAEVSAREARLARMHRQHLDNEMQKVREQTTGVHGAARQRIEELTRQREEQSDAVNALKRKKWALEDEIADTERELDERKRTTDERAAAYEAQKAGEAGEARAGARERGRPAGQREHAGVQNHR